MATRENPFREPRENPFLERRPNPFRESGPVSRVVAAGVEAGTEALKLDDPLGPSEETLQPLKDIGLFPDNPIGEFNRLVVGAPLEALDIMDRGAMALIEGGIGVLSATIDEFGGFAGKTEREKFERDSSLMIELGLLRAGPAIAQAGARAQFRKGVREEMAREIEKTVDNLSPDARQAIMQQLDESLLPSADQAALDSARAKIGQKTFAESKQEARFTFGQRIITNTLDELAPIKFLAEGEARKRGLTPDLTPYRDARLTRGVEGVVDAVMKRGTIRLDDGDVVFRGKPLNDVLGPITANLDDAGLYFAGRRARELKDRGIEVPFTDEEVAAMINIESRLPAVSQAFDDYQAFNREMLDFAEQSGVLSAETKKAYMKGIEGDRKSVV